MIDDIYDYTLTDADYERIGKEMRVEVTAEQERYQQDQEQDDWNWDWDGEREWNNACERVQEMFGSIDWDDAQHEAKKIMSRRAKERHNAYLQSNRWKKVRAVVMKRDEGKCRLCGGNAKDVHHDGYECFAMGEPYESQTCIAICHDCHKRVHRKGEYE